MQRIAGVFLVVLLIGASLGVARSAASEGDELLARTIAYHDPLGRWMQSRIKLTVEGRSADGRVTLRDCTIDNRNGDFSIAVAKDGVTAEQGWTQGEYWCRVGEDDHPTEAARREYSLSPDRARLMRDYMGYLWGLPMKLRDPGTWVDPRVDEAIFRGQKVLVIRIRYDPDVGDDRWRIFVDPDDAHMVGYAFYHDQEETDGEYIVLEGEVLVADAKIPRSRSWYRVGDDEYLGTDVLVKGAGF